LDGIINEFDPYGTGLVLPHPKNLKQYFSSTLNIDKNKTLYELAEEIRLKK
jgi:hypothetical protein